MNNWRVNVRRAACALGAAVLLGVTVSCDEPEQESGRNGVERLNVGYKEDQPGTSFRDESTNVFDGFEVQLGLHLEEKIKKRLFPVDLKTKDRVQVVKDGDVDLLLATLSVNEDRIQEVDFAGIYMTSRQGLLVSDEAYANGIKDPTVFAGKKICTLEGSTSYTTLMEYRPDVLSLAEIEPASKIKDCVKLLEEGRVQGISTDQVILYGLADHHADQNFYVVPEIDFGPTQYYGVAVKKMKDREWCRYLKEIVDKYVRSSTWEQNFKIQLGLAEEEVGFRKFRPSRHDSNAMSCRDEVGP
ncbi:transporter substrate-binding domain-containing protein [Streptomyces somaliensis]|uniref:Transporter substrate-binding domain-containing protein n=1 Tax=Streptomyces somaliensis (strain ATCC 33201 / DSM 40738 / JCM 12659 / KCTC 9044 / NCTC 11332 / NRRL B-12077 / IP 733) TaxID=1134445 RepID=A0AA44IED0_STRE0|nr:transporter substrate-binding domain-containing protein [Streptomyces somaliensis]NKY15640.1 transporter substrate-binding domain-containing protein [Streptomyces somaliensis DSM 40738]